MTDIVFAIGGDTAHGVRFGNVSVVARSVRNRVADDTLIMKSTLKEIFNGEPGVMSLPATGLGEAWVITVTDNNGVIVSGFYKIPESDQPVLFTDLVAVDPDSLEPDADPEPEWWAMAKSTVYSGEVNADGDLILTRTSGDSFNAGHVKGERGLKGDKGDPGEQGEQGERGLKGDRGEQGLQGERGLKGDRGERGEQGLQGVQGVKGDKGDEGAWRSAMDKLPLLTQDMSRFDPLCYWECRPANSSQWTQGFSVNEDTEEIYVSAHNYNIGIEVPAQWIECRGYDGTLKWRTPDIPVPVTSAYSEGLPYFYNSSGDLCFILRLNSTGDAFSGFISLYNSVTNEVFSTMTVKGNSKLFSDGDYFYTTTSIAAYASLYTVYKYSMSSVIAGTPQLVASYSMQNFGQSINDEKPQGFMVMDGKFVTSGGARATNIPDDNGRPGFRIYDSSGDLLSSTSLERKDFKRAMAEVFPPELVYPTGINGVNYENEGLYPLRDGRIMVMHNLYTYSFLTIHGTKGEQKAKIVLGNISRASADWQELSLNTAGGIVPFDSDSIPKFKYDGSALIIRGGVKGVETIGGSFTLATLPAAYRMTLPNWNAICVSNGSTYWRCRVSNGGNIQIINYSGTITPNTWLALDMVIPYSVNY